jgi:hypothetical protein
MLQNVVFGVDEQLEGSMLTQDTAGCEFADGNCQAAQFPDLSAASLVTRKFFSVKAFNWTLILWWDHVSFQVVSPALMVKV